MVNVGGLSVTKLPIKVLITSQKLDVLIYLAIFQ